MSIATLVDDAARELQDIDHVRWSRADLVDYINQAMFELIRFRPDIVAETVTLNLSEGTRQVVPDDSMQLIELVRNEPSGHAIRYVDERLLSASAPNWHGRPASGRIHDYCWDSEQPSTFYVYPPAKSGTKVQAVVARYPSQVRLPDSGADWSDATIEQLTRRDGERLITSLARDLAIGRDWSTRGFVEGLFDANAEHIIRADLRCPTLESWRYIREAIADFVDDSDAVTDIEALIGNISDVFAEPGNYRVTQGAEPQDLASDFTADESVYHTIMDEALDGTVIQDMWDDIVANANSECGTSTDWSSGNLEELTKRDALGLLSAIAQDFFHGNARSTRSFVENLFKPNGSTVFDSSLLCAFKHSYDFLVSAFEPILGSGTDAFQTFSDLIQLVKDSLDNPETGVLRIKAPDISDQITQDRAASLRLLALRGPLVELMWKRLVNESGDNCPDVWQPFPLALHWRDVVLDGVLYRALSSNTDAASVERARFYQQRFTEAAGVQRSAKIRHHPRNQRPVMRSDDDGN